MENRAFTVSLSKNPVVKDEDEAKTDYSEELEILKMIWKERLEKEGGQFY